ncbi:cytochrome P450 [Sistotremastrum suecicum HHB10207 ss-3]|uniref:Cytochrome P450 n=1 Tax=Sistotremastrum suecicum HHB10207 ss-3 TaxID=1314776 RepID=A0A165YIA5_9AGAM|nr:cytochrome P450 [Sistotremastrum suecicum HHB10207 ss-3]
MMHNPHDFPDALKFLPERFVERHENGYILRSDVQNPEDIGFGFGRRICPGRYFASSWLWVTIATSLGVFEILPEIDPAGNPVLPDLEYEPRLVSHPKPFRCQLRVRPSIASLLDHE